MSTHRESLLRQPIELLKGIQVDYAMPCTLPSCEVLEVQETKSLKNSMIKKSEGKPSKVAIVACINKLLH